MHDICYNEFKKVINARHNLPTGYTRPVLERVSSVQLYSWVSIAQAFVFAFKSMLSPSRSRVCQLPDMQYGPSSTDLTSAGRKQTRVMFLTTRELPLLSAFDFITSTTEIETSNIWFTLPLKPLTMQHVWYTRWQG